MKRTISYKLRFLLLAAILLFLDNVNAQIDKTNDINNKTTQIKNKNFASGKITLPSGELYEGEYTFKKKGLLIKIDSLSIKRNGYGTTYYRKSNKIHLVGNYINDTITGEGSLYDTSGIKEYKGTFHKGLLKGNVKVYRNKKLIYDGLINDTLKMHGTGTYFDSMGKIIYNGEFINGKKWGQGTYYFDNKNWYSGNWAMDKPNGKGIQSFISKDKQVLADGNFSDGIRNGKFVICYKESKDTLFDGYFKNGEMNGFGKLFTENNIPYYTGYFKDNKFDGEGIIHYNDGAIQFKGLFNKGKKNGPFIEYYPNGKKAKECTYFNDTIQGYVLIYYQSNGKLKWAGNYADNQANGFGIFYALEYKVDLSKTGFTYIPMEETDTMQGRKEFEGEYKNGKAHGQGTSFYENGAVKYVGLWIEGNAEGKGVSYRENGTKIHEGEYKNGKINGVGITYNEKGKKDFEGLFIDGLANGYGTSYDENGNISKQGDWIKGEFQNEGKSISTNNTTSEEDLQLKLKKICHICEGSGIAKRCICSNGYRHCGNCHGTRFLRNGKVCLSCRGSGLAICSLCNGKIKGFKCDHLKWYLIISGL